MKVGVTGGAGFLGGYVVGHLIECGHEPVIFDHLARRGPHPDVEVMLGDTRDAVAVTELAAHVEGIIHLASVLGTQETIKNPRPAAETNLISALNVYEACSQYDLACVNIGVGNHWFNNTYSISKSAAERFGFMFATERGLRVNQIRALNAYGPRQSIASPYGSARVRKITPAFVCRALTGQPIEVYGDGSQVSAMVWAGDVADALVTALQFASKGVVLDRTVEVGPLHSTTVRETAELVARLAADVTGRDPSPITCLPMRPGERPGDPVVADTSTLPLIGMHADDLLPLVEGMRRTVAWYAEHWLPGWLGERE